jgi:SAM-dependent methyltransferase
MFSSGPDIVSSITELSSAAWAYTGVSMAFELGIVRALDEPSSAARIASRLDLDPALVEDLLGVLVAIGAVERTGERGDVFAATAAFGPFRSGSLARVMRAGIRSDQMQTAEAFRSARAGSLDPGWAHRDPDVLVAQGETAGLFRLAAEHVLPSLPGLRDRLERSGAAFLDVGAGVGVLSREICMVYPEVEATCLEPNEAARALGRERCRESGLEGRIEFISHAVGELEPQPRFDLALIPQPFLHPDAFATGLGHVRQALRPGGWLLVLALDLPDHEPLTAASRRVRARLWGGGALECEDLIAMLRDDGFSDVQAHAPIGAYRMYVARRPVAAAADAELGAPGADPIAA